MSTATESQTYTFTEKTLLTELMSITLDELKAAPDVWQKMSEQEQDDVIQRLNDRVTDAVKQTIYLITSQGFVTLPATLESVTIKDGIKAQLTFNGLDPHRHALIDKANQTVTVVLASLSDVLHPVHEHKADPQQPDMLSAEQLKKIANSEAAKPKKKKGED